MQTLKKKKKKSFGPEVARVYTPAERSHMLDKILWFGGLWKHPNSSACHKSVRSLRNVQTGQYTKENEAVLSEVLAHVAEADR